MPDLQPLIDAVNNSTCAIYLFIGILLGAISCLQVVKPLG